MRSGFIVNLRLSSPNSYSNQSAAMDALFSTSLSYTSCNDVRHCRSGNLISSIKPFAAPAPPVISAVKAQEKPQRGTRTRTKRRSDDNYGENSRSHGSSSPLHQPQLKPQYPTPRLRAREPSAAAAFCIALDDLINNFIDLPHLRPSVDPRHVLSDNWAPVNELPPTACPVVRGAIPACLRGGAYIRNGPNPQYLPRGPHHLFDGDGMLNALLLPQGGDGTAPGTLCSRYVRTYKFLLERDAGGPVLPNVFSGINGAAGIARGVVAAARILTGQINPSAGFGLANTSVAFFGGRLYALGESDLPYAVRISPQDGDITTLGRCNFEGRLSMGMTAHPKKDPATGELFAFRYGPVPPFLTYFRFDAEGNYKTGEDVPIFSLTQPSMVHDFAITERFAIFPDIQIVMKPMDMVAPGGGSPVGSDRRKVPRLGVLPKYAQSDAGMRWFEVPGFNVMHTINAWEEGDVIVLVAPNVLSIEHALDRMELIHSTVEMVRIDMGNGVVSRTPLSAENLDFGLIHPGYIGRKNRFAYLGVGDPMPKISGVRKLDFSLHGKGDCIVAARDFGPDCFGGEPFFVPAGECGEEDDGYVISYLHDERNKKSKFVVMDARSPQLDVVAEVMLPSRVPYGFHGLFLTQADIRAQRPY